jgi:hypothetical protein
MSSSLQPPQKVSKRTSRRRRLRSKDNSLEILKYAIYNSYRIKRRAAKEEKRRLEEKTGIISPMPRLAKTLDNNPNKLSLSCKKLDLLKKGLVTAFEESKLDAKQTEKKMASHVVNNTEPAKQDCNQTKRVLSVVNGNIINNEKHLEKIRLLERRLTHRKLAV